MKPIILLLRHAVIWGAIFGAMALVLTGLWLAMMAGDLGVVFVFVQRPIATLWLLANYTLWGTAIMAVVMIIAVVAKRLFGGH